MANPKVIAVPDEPLVSLEVCRAQCEIVAIDTDSDGNTSHPDDGLLLAYLDAAVEAAEDFTGLAISLRTYEQALDAFPDGAIELAKSPFVDLLSFTVVGYGSDGEMDEELYEVDSYSQLTRLVPVSTWPSMTAGTNAIRVMYRAGYSDTDTDAEHVPASIRQAVLLLLGHFYANREDSTEKAMQSIPMGFEALLRPKRVRFGMA